MSEEENKRYEQDDLEAVVMMLNMAKAAGLIAEVVLSFSNLVAEGESIQSAAHAAAYEWDC